MSNTPESDTGLRKRIKCVLGYCEISKHECLYDSGRNEFQELEAIMALIQTAIDGAVEREVNVLINRLESIASACIQLHVLPHYENLIAFETGKIGRSEYFETSKKNIDKYVSYFMHDAREVAKEQLTPSPVEHKAEGTT